MLTCKQSTISTMDFIIVEPKVEGEGWPVMAADDPVRGEFQEVSVPDRKAIAFVQNYTDLHMVAARHGLDQTRIVGIEEMEKELGPMP
jgi:hypothetical protein